MKTAVLMFVAMIMAVSGVVIRFKKKTKEYRTAISLKQIQFCDYKGFEWSSGKVGFADDCFECTCPDDSDVWSCVGYGRNAGTITTPPPGCRRNIDGCQWLFYKTNPIGEMVDCFTGKSFKDL